MTAAVETNFFYTYGREDDTYAGTAGIYLMERDSVPTTVNDARGREEAFSLDQNGFEFHTFKTENDFPSDKEEFKARQYPEVINFLKAKTGASRVICVDHLIRRQKYEDAVEFAKTHDPMAKTNMTVPARFVHVDQSYRGAEDFLHDNVDDALAEKLTRSRWGIINVWRPLKPLKRDPLGVCDGSSVPEEDLREFTFNLKGPNGTYTDISKGDKVTSWSVFRPQQPGAHKWWYLNGMTEDEVILIKCFDSKKDGRCRRAPHSAFEDKRYLDEEARTSVEVRCLVFWEDQDVD